MLGQTSGVSSLYCISGNSIRGTAPTLGHPQSLTRLSAENLKALLYLSPIENKETLHQRLFYICRIIRNCTGAFERTAHPVSMRALIKAGDSLSIFCEFLLGEQ
jgi:hypothetical protein